MKNGFIPRRHFCPTNRPRRWRGGDHGDLGLFQFGKLKSGETAYVPGGSGGVGSMVVQMAKAAGARSPPRPAAPSASNFASRWAPIWLSTTRPTTFQPVREFAPEGFDVWYETLREPNLEVSIPLLRKHGRMILMAGRAAKPVLPLGAFYPRNCALLGFAMFNATPDEQEPCARDMIRWIEDGQLKPLVGRTFPLAAAAQAEKFLEANTGGWGGLALG